MTKSAIIHQTDPAIISSLGHDVHAGSVFTLEHIMENWKDVPGYEGFYQVSNIGRVRSLDRIINCRRKSGNWPIKRRGKILSPGLGGTAPYLFVYLCKNTQKKMWMIHRLVLLSFVGPPEKGLEAHHKNGNKQDNRLKNLGYLTRSENQLHSHRVLGNKSVGSPGSKNGSAKLNEAQVLEIRRLGNSLSRKKLAEQFGVNTSTIADIIKRRNWKHI